MSDYRGRNDKTNKEAYECGFEDGYEKAIEEMEGYGHRSSYRDYDMGERRSMRRR
jgi:hypothetical protein